MKAAALLLALGAAWASAPELLGPDPGTVGGVIVFEGREFPGFAPLPAQPPYPPDNPPHAAKEALGRDLFMDPLLSGDRAMSCATCHAPDRDFRDGRARGRARQELDLGRKTPSLKNVAYNRSFFWDGRAPSLEAQFFMVLQSHDEMNMQPDELQARLKASPEYPARFRAVFGEEGISTRTISYAVAAYERTLRVGETNFDAFLRGEPALLAGQKKALELFKGKARCIVCHHGPNLSDGKFHNVGLRPPFWKKRDLGLQAVDGKKESYRKFRTPSLRNASHSTPYMHDGSLQRAEDLLEFYNRGGDDKKNLDPDIKPLGLTREEILALKALLYSMGERDAGTPLYDHITTAEEESAMHGRPMPAPVGDPGSYKY